MTFQTVFKRYELKYMLTLEQKQKILEAMSPYMELDKYGRSCVRNIYFDTASYILIRRSIEKPAYKEKLRIRSYSQAISDSTVFVELKKKFEKVVYKRRLPLCEADAMEWVCRSCLDAPERCDTLQGYREENQAIHDRNHRCYSLCEYGQRKSSRILYFSYILNQEEKHLGNTLSERASGRLLRMAYTAMVS